MVAILENWIILLIPDKYFSQECKLNQAFQTNTHFKKKNTAQFQV